MIIENPIGIKAENDNGVPYEEWLVDDDVIYTVTFLKNGCFCECTPGQFFPVADPVKCRHANAILTWINNE